MLHFGLTLLLFLSVNVKSHMMLIWPPPRLDSTDSAGGGGLTMSPCGGSEYSISDPDNNDNITELEPGVNTIIINPVARHPNNMYRIALSGSNSDDYSECTLLDSIPQSTVAGVNRLLVNVSIPNLDCDMCGLQVYMVGPSGACCDKEAGECGTTYYSCATVKINGKKKWNKIECEQPCHWDYRDWPAGYYTGESNDNQYMLNGGDLHLLINNSYMTPDSTCCSTVFGNDGCDDTSDDKCDGFGSNANAKSSSGSSGYTASQKKAGEEAGIAIFIILVLAIGGTMAYVKYVKKEDLSKNNGEANIPGIIPYEYGNTNTTTNGESTLKENTQNAIVHSNTTGNEDFQVYEQTSPKNTQYAQYDFPEPQPYDGMQQQQQQQQQPETQPVQPMQPMQPMPPVPFVPVMTQQTEMVESEAQPQPNEYENVNYDINNETYDNNNDYNNTPNPYSNEEEMEMEEEPIEVEEEPVEVEEEIQEDVQPIQPQPYVSNEYNEPPPMMSNQLQYRESEIERAQETNDTYDEYEEVNINQQSILVEEQPQTQEYETYEENEEERTENPEDFNL